jgi:PAS domain S-box-containing protein
VGEGGALVAYGIALLVCAGVAVWAWLRRDTPGGRPFALGALAQAVAVFGFVCELASPTLEGKIFWDDVQWVPTLIRAPAFFIFAEEHTGVRFLPRRWRWPLMAGPPAVYMALVLTDRWHDLIRPTAELVHAPPWDALVYPFTPVTWALALYLYAMVIGALVVLVRHALRSTIHRANTVLVVAGVSVPMIGHLLTMAGAFPEAHRDVSPFAFAIGNLLIATGLARYGLFDIRPIARAFLVEHALDAIVILEGDRIIDLNPSAERLLGRTRAESIGRPVTALDPIWQERLTRAIEGTRSEETITVGEGEDSRQLALILSALPDRRGRIVGRVLVARDLTKLQKAQAELRVHAAEVESRNRDLDDFAQFVSHDLQAPLRAVDGFARILAETQGERLDERGRAAVERIREGSARMRAFVAGLLSIARAQRQDVRKARVSIHELAIAVVDDLRADAEAAKVEVILGELPGTRADPVLIRQVLTNLVTNAITHAAGPNGCRVWIESVTKNGETVYTVRDDGIGFGPGDAERFFRPFIQRPDATGGHGVGLAVVRRIVERHGGRIWAESSPGKGAAFHFTLP